MWFVNTLFHQSTEERRDYNALDHLDSIADDCLRSFSHVYALCMRYCVRGSRRRTQNESALLRDGTYSTYNAQHKVADRPENETATEYLYLGNHL